MANNSVPHVGKIVLYIEDDGVHSNPAIVTTVHDPQTVDLVFFQTHGVSEPAFARHNVRRVKEDDPTPGHRWKEIETD